MRPQIIAIGEAIVDFISTVPGPYSKVSTFQKFFGGAPMNTIVGISRLGIKAGAITAVGDDPLGAFLLEELIRNNVDTSYVKIKKGKRTTIAFVANEPTTGERMFFFYRKPWSITADSTLETRDINLNYIAQATILHVSGFALSQSPCREAVMKAVRYARRAGVKVSFDPTLRIDVWDSVRDLRRIYTQMLRLSDISTFSKGEAQFILGTNEPEKAAKIALKQGIETVGIKLGAQGSFLMTTDGKKIGAPAFRVKSIDTTGAGDGWNAALLVGICKGWDLKRCILLANAVGALVVTKRGAITALPYKEELRKFLKIQNIEVDV